ncbi:MAG TPA: alpha/beta hydrolase family protein [Chitinophagaceae bacterium]
MRFSLLLISCLLVQSAFSRVDTVRVYSESMQKNVSCVVITPKKIKKHRARFPVVYLLHGYAGDYANWIRRVPALDRLANALRLIIVCPDGAWSSWYFDSPVDSSYRYETFTSTELPQFIDTHYPTISDRKARAITGLSMGGHGAMFLALRHPGVFGAAGSMSGALDVSTIKRSYDVPRRLGDTIQNLRYYQDWSVVNLLERYNPADSIAFIIDCGVNDFIFSMSRAAHQKMLNRKIPHDYIERPGAHDWKYWANAVRYQLLFFREWFNKND